MTEDYLKDLVDEADTAALETVRAERGGPFGAILCLYNMKTGAVRRIGDPAGNAVLATGLASAHAEDQVLSPANIAELEARLQTAAGRDSCIVLASSAESCPACHAKAEILARILMHEGFIEPGRFVLAYGAAYHDTKMIAGFNDEPYHADMLRPASARLIAIETTRTPDRALTAPAMVVLPDGRHFSAHDHRERHFTLTPEVSAIRAAVLNRKHAGEKDPWNLGGAILYTHTTEPGPLAYAECQWANVTRWVGVEGGAPAHEAPDIANESLFRAVAQRPYNGPGAAVRVVQVEGFENRAQKEWKCLLDRGTPGLALYNGIKA